MIERKLTLPELLLIAGTRVALGAGIGLLLSSRLNDDQRKAAGLSLALIGALTTIPLAIGIIGKQSEELRPAPYAGGGRPLPHADDIMCAWRRAANFSTSKAST